MHAIFEMLPRGLALDASTWGRRHRWIMLIVWVNVAALTLAAALLNYSTAHQVAHVAPFLVLALIAMRTSVRRRLRAVSACLALLMCSAMLVHLTHGLIESHFHFFVAIAFLCLYEDWLIFLVAVGFVLLHHAVGGALAPGDVFAHPGNPWVWALIHAAFVAAAGVANVVTWRQNEDVRAEMARAYDTVRVNEERLSRTLAEAPIGMCLLDLQPSTRGRLIEVNRRLREMLGLDDSELLQCDFPTMLDQESQLAVRDGLALLAAGREARDTLDVSLTRRDGRVLWMRVSMSALRDETGTPIHAIGQIEDVTDQRRADRYQLAQEGLTQILSASGGLAPEAVVARALPVLGKALGSAVVAAWWADDAGWRARCTHAWTDGDRASDERAAAMRRTPLHRGKGLAGMAWQHGRPKLTATTGSGSAGLSTICALPLLDGSTPIGAIEVIGGEAQPSDEALVAMLSTFTSRIAQFLVRRRVEDELSYRAQHDPLTGLPNRALFVARLEEVLERSRRTGEAVCVLYLDLDGFKLANDTLGHAAGDEILVATAERLTATLRPGDIVARFGGDEFTILCPTMQPEAIEPLALRIADAVAAPCSISGQRVVLSASIGIALSTDGQDDAEALMGNADDAMYQAKASGKARHRVFDNRSRRQSDQRLQLLEELRNSISNDEIPVFFQPIVDTADGTVVGLEALARWSNPTRGLMLPGEFIPLAEQGGLVVPLGNLVLEQACRAATQWPAATNRTAPPQLNVNLSPVQLADGDVVDRVRAALDASGLPPCQLCLEVTESAVMRDIDMTVARLRALRELGVRIAIDDFGSGLSSLAQLRQLPVDVLKIDRGFVTGIPDSHEDMEIVAAIVTLARALDIEVVVEGIETAEQAAAVRELRCGTAQGFYFGVPQPAAAVAELLAAVPRSLDWAEDRSGSVIAFPREDLRQRRAA